VLGFCSFSALDRSLADAAALAARIGLDGLEVTAHPPHLDPADGVDAARAAGRAVRAAGIPVIAYGSYLGRYGQVTAADAARAAAIAAALQTPLLRVWAEPIAEGAADLAASVALLRAACDACAADGITVAIERHLGSFADTAENVVRLLDAIDRPNVALNYQVLDFLPMERAAAQPADAERLVPFACYFHLKNYQPNADSEGPMFPGGGLATGVLDYRAILGAAVRAGYRGPFTIEFLAADDRPVEEKLAADAAFVRGILAELGVE
jgi:sugar phosphate isomerase/epimerase